jgi:hypothetical protein
METLSIGQETVKKSGKPFKSKLKVNTVAGFMVHPKTGRPCYIFLEDDSYVECFMCKLK